MDQTHTNAVTLTPAPSPRGTGRVALADVARLCGVTPATVSRVLNRSKTFSTSDEVRDRIHATATQLGYDPRGSRAGGPDRSRFDRTAGEALIL